MLPKLRLFVRKIEDIERVSSILTVEFMNVTEIVEYLSSFDAYKTLLSIVDEIEDQDYVKLLKSNVNESIYEVVLKYDKYLKDQLNEIKYFLEKYEPKDTRSNIELDLSYFGANLELIKTMLSKLRSIVLDQERITALNTIVNAINSILKILYDYYLTIIKIERSVVVKKTLRLSLKNVIKTYRLELLDEIFKF